MVIEGVDYSVARPSPPGLYAAGKRFAVRYVGPGSAPKHLTAAELAALTAAGLEVVANAEGAAGGFTGAAAGRSWATFALAACKALGMPVGRPIYFSVDWDAGSKDWAGIDAALKAAAAVVGGDLVGVYGSYDTVAHCLAAGTARWLWQTYAWSSGRQHPRANLYQYKNGVTVAGGDVDLTRALTVDYGQWGIVDMALSDQDVQDIWTKGSVDTNNATSGYAKGLDARVKAATAPILAAVNALAAKLEVNTTALALDIAGVDEAVIAQLGDPATPDEEVAAALVSLLGDRKDAVLALMR